MSFELEFFQMRENVGVEAINEFLASPQQREYIERMESDLNASDWPLIPAEMFESKLPYWTLRRMLEKAYIRTVIPDDKRNDLMKRYLEMPDTEDTPSGLELDVFEGYGPGGMVERSMRAGGSGIEEEMAKLFSVLKTLQGERIAMFDPQSGRVYDGRHSVADMT